METKTKKKWYKRKSLYIILVIIIAVAGLAWKSKSSSSIPKYETVKVARGEVIQTVDAAGNIESSNDLDLRFEASGRVYQIYKQTNDQVKKGEVIMDLDLSELNARVAQANAAVAQAKANLDKEIVGDTPEYIQGLAALLAQSQAGLAQTRVVSEAAIHSAQATLETAENNLKMAEGGEKSQIVQDAYDQMFALLQSVQNILSGALTEADNILGIDNTLANDDFDDVLSSLDTGKLSLANSKYLAAKSAKIDFDDRLNKITKNSDQVTIDFVISQADESLILAKSMLFSVAEVLDKTPPIGELTQAELTVMKTNIETARTSVSTKYTSLITQEQAIETAKNSYTSYQIAYDKAKKDLETTKNKAEADMAVQQAGVDKAQAVLNDAQNPPRDIDLAGNRAALASAQANLEQVLAARDKAKIIAPTDGVVGKIDVKIGEYASAQDVVAKLVSPHFEVKVDIPETDIVKVTLGDEAEIKLDAYGDEIKFKGSVVEIEKGQTEIQDVIYYQVTVSMVDGLERQILNGMTANVVFSTDKKENVLYIPQRVIRSRDNGIKYVRVLIGKEVKEIDIKTGLRGDEGLVEVLEGLAEGQDVVVSST